MLDCCSDARSCPIVAVARPGLRDRVCDREAAPWTPPYITSLSCRCVVDRPPRVYRFVLRRVVEPAPPPPRAVDPFDPFDVIARVDRCGSDSQAVCGKDMFEPPASLMRSLLGSSSNPSTTSLLSPSVEGCVSTSEGSGTTRRAAMNSRWSTLPLPSASIASHNASISIGAIITSRRRSTLSNSGRSRSPLPSRSMASKAWWTSWRRTPKHVRWL